MVVSILQSSPRGLTILSGEDVVGWMNDVRTSIENESIFKQILMEYRETEFGFAHSAKAKFPR
jgi:hypothetical protein